MDSGPLGLNSEMFQEIWNLHEFTVLLMVAILMGKPVPPQVFREECVKGICQKYAGVAPERITILSEYDALLKFVEGVMVTDVRNVVKQSGQLGSL